MVCTPQRPLSKWQPQSRDQPGPETKGLLCPTSCSDALPCSPPDCRQQARQEDAGQETGWALPVGREVGKLSGGSGGETMVAAIANIQPSGEPWVHLLFKGLKICPSGTLHWTITIYPFPSVGQSSTMSRHDYKAMCTMIQVPLPRRWITHDATICIITLLAL